MLGSPGPDNGLAELLPTHTMEQWDEAEGFWGPWVLFWGGGSGVGEVEGGDGTDGSSRGRLDVALVCTAFPETLRAGLEGGGRWEDENIPIGIMQQSSWISFHGAEGK